jgi:hypothetical protein
MTRLIRRLLLLLATTTMLAGPAAAASCQPAALIDHIAFGYLPSGLGTSSDFSYHYRRVDFTARVWESRVEDGWQVDLDIDVMRGARLTSGRALHDWFIAYEERDPTPRYERVRVHGHPGWLSRDQVFWLVRPGLAVSAQLDSRRWSRHDVLHIGRAAHRTGYDGALTEAIVRSSSQIARNDTILPSSSTR